MLARLRHNLARRTARRAIERRAGVLPRWRCPAGSDRLSVPAARFVADLEGDLRRLERHISTGP